MSENSIPPVAAELRDPIPLTYWEFLCSFINEIFRSPLNFILVAIIAWLIYKIFQSKPRQKEPVQVTKELAKIRRDFTLDELKEYNGTGPDGRILVAVNGNVYDVTNGARFYGPGTISSIFSCLTRVCSEIILLF
jgi:membrane-associated progesterone receptor component